MAARRRPAVLGSKAPESLRPLCRNVKVDGRRTSIRMEPVLWDCLSEISRREDRAVNDVVTQIDQRRGDSALTAALRVFILAYFREASRPGQPSGIAMPAPVGGFAEEAFPPLSSTFDSAMQVFRPSN